MTRKELSKFKPETADYVIIHAKWSASRGRKPSMSFGYERDPKKALLLALACHGLNIIDIFTPPKPECKSPRSGLRVTIADKLDSAEGMCIRADYLDPINRKAGITGKLLTCAAGHGGDVWFVEHEENIVRVGAYTITEFKRHPVQHPKQKAATLVA